MEWCRREVEMRGNWITSKNRHAYRYNVAVKVGRSTSCTIIQLGFIKINDIDDLIRMICTCT